MMMIEISHCLIFGRKNDIDSFQSAAIHVKNTQFFLYIFRLVPNTVLTFVAGESGDCDRGNHLKEDLLMLIQPV